jgi:hypothetical protein
MLAETFLSHNSQRGCLIKAIIHAIDVWVVSFCGVKQSISDSLVQRLVLFLSPSRCGLLDHDVKYFDLRIFHFLLWILSKFMVQIIEDLEKAARFFVLNNVSRLNRRVNVIEKEELYRSLLFSRLNIWKLPKNRRFPVDCNNFTGMHFTVRVVLYAFSIEIICGHFGRFRGPCHIRIPPKGPRYQTQIGVQRTKIRPASSTCAGRAPRDDIEIDRSKPSCPASKIEFFDYFDCLDFEKLEPTLSDHHLPLLPSSCG